LRRDADAAAASDCVSLIVCRLLLAAVEPVREGVERDDRPTDRSDLGDERDRQRRSARPTYWSPVSAGVMARCWSPGMVTSPV